MNDRAKKLIQALWPDAVIVGNDFTVDELRDAASAYDKLAEQAQRCLDVDRFGEPKWESQQAETFKKRAAELRAMIPKEETQLEKDVEELQGYADISASSRTILYILEQLKRQGKE